MSQLANRLQSGDKIAVVNVAAPEPVIFPDRLLLGIEKLRGMGFEIVEADHLRKRHGIFSSEPAIVAHELNHLWGRDDIAGIICAGGGIAANALLPHIDYELFRSQPKIIVGASNPTVLLNAIAKKSNIATFHGPSVIWDFGDQNQPTSTLDNFANILMKGELCIGHIPKFLVAGEAKGRVFGGNLSSLLAQAGTDWFPDMIGAILLWEEIGESADRIYSKMVQLDEMGVLNALSGMIVGELVDCQEVDGYTPVDAVLEVCSKYSFPIGWGLPFGHTPEKVVVPIGGQIAISSITGQIKLEKAVVK